MLYSEEQLTILVKRISLIAAIFAGIIIIMFMCFLFFSVDTTIEEVRLKKFSGVVLEKYRIRYEHDSPVIKIKSANKEDTVIYLNHFNASLFENLQIGDTVSTKSGDTTVLINRKGNKFIIYKTEYPVP